MALTRDIFNERLESLLPRLMRHFSHFEQNALTRGEISLPQFWALMFLGAHGQCSMHELADHLQIQLPSATGLVDRLVRLGLATRGQVAGDRRIVTVRPTPRGRQMIRRIRNQKRASHGRLFRSLDNTERAQFLNIVQKLVAAMEKKMA